MVRRGSCSAWAGRATGVNPDEEAQYKLDGLILIIEGIGKTKADGKVALQALGIVSYDDEAGTYRMRAYNDGRYLETRSEAERKRQRDHLGLRTGRDQDQLCLANQRNR